MAPKEKSKFKPTIRKKWAAKRQEKNDQALTKTQHEAFLAGAAWHLKFYCWFEK